MNLPRRLSSIALAVGLLLLAAGAPAQALAAEAEVTVHVVRASKKPGKTDPRLKRFQKQFEDFAYKSYQLEGVKKVKLKSGKAETVQLAGGKSLTVNLNSVGKDGKARLKLAIPGVVDTTVSMAKGGDVVLGGPAMPHGDGVLFVPITVNKIKK